MALDDTRKAAIEAYLGVSGASLNDLEYTYYADLLANGVQIPSGNLATTIHAATGKTVLADDDEVPIIDSAASNVLKKSLWSSIKSSIYSQLTNITSGVLGLVYVGTSGSAPSAVTNSAKFGLFTDTGWLMRANGTVWDRVGGGPVAIDTWANLLANYSAASYTNCLAIATNIGPNGTVIRSNGSAWRVFPASQITLGGVSTTGYLVFGGNAATYSQSATTVTVTQAGHGLTADFNGCSIYLTQSTGTFTTEWCTNFTYVNANSFTCTSATSRTTSGNLGTNTAETFIPWTYQVPANLLAAKDVLSVVGYQRVNSSQAGTIKSYYNGVQVASTALSNTVWTSYGPAGQTFLSGTTYVTNGVSSAILTDSNRTYTISLQNTAPAATAFYLPIGGVTYNGRS